MDIKGFILDSAWHDDNNRLVLSIYASGPLGPFCILINNFKPVFFIERDCKVTVPGVFERKEVQLSSFGRKHVDALYFSTQKALLAAADLFRNKGIRTYESDVNPMERFLMERFVTGSFKVTGQQEMNQNGLMIFHNPKISSEYYKPELSLFSFDLETAPDGAIISAAVTNYHKKKKDSVVFFRPFPDNPEPDYHKLDSNIELIAANSEKQLLENFLTWLYRKDPDIIAGWNITGFDIPRLHERCRNHGIPFVPGRSRKPFILSRLPDRQRISGRILLDGLTQLRYAGHHFMDFSLDNVASEILGENKTIQLEGTAKITEIERQWKEEPLELIKYNLKDTVLAANIIKETKLLDLIIEKCLITGLPPQRSYLSIAAFEYFYLPRLHRKGFVAPDKKDISAGQAGKGGWVMTPVPGLRNSVAVMDFKSLYPSIIRTFHIDPYALLQADHTHSSPCPAGQTFSREEHILPEFLEQLMRARGEARKVGNSQLSQAIKILMNSFYGVMGTTDCRFYNHQLPDAITMSGQWVLKESKRFLEEQNYNVLYGDTDSLFTELKKSDRAGQEEEAKELVSSVNQHFIRKFRRTYDLESHMELELEKIYDVCFFPPSRHSEEGARKRYAGRLYSGEIEFKGMETVRSDWTQLAREFQKELYHIYFSKGDILELYKTYIMELKLGKRDHQLIYRKRLKKKPEEYTKTTPPHVKAALLIKPENRKRFVEYLITREGPLPTEYAEIKADYDHYIEKQLKPIMEPVWIASGGLQEVLDNFESRQGQLKF